MKRQKVATIILFILTFIILMQFALYSANSLNRLQNDWVSLKSVVKTHLLSQDEYHSTRVVVHKNQLNLNTWHGYNGVFLDKKIIIKEIKFDANFPDQESTFTVVTGFNGNGYYGIRLSANKKNKNAFVFADKEGRFKLIKQLPIKNFVGSIQFFIKYEKNKIILKWKSDFEETSHIIEFNNIIQAGFFGFIGGKRSGLSIDDIVITTPTQKIKENFTNKKDILVAIIFSMLMILIVVVICQIFSRTIRLDNLAYLTIFLTLGFIASITFYYDYNWWSKNYYVGFSFKDKSKVNLFLEDKRTKFFNFMASLNENPSLLPLNSNFSKMIHQSKNNTVCNLTKGFPYKSEDRHEAHKLICNSENRLKTIKFGFIGSSQTYGSGAFRLEDSWVNQFNRKLQANLKCSIESINMSVSGADPGYLYNKFITLWKDYKFDYVFINLSSNGSFENLKKYYPLIIKEVGSRSALPILLVEANDDELVNIKKKNFIKKFANLNNLPMVNLSSFMNSKKVIDSGFLWFDYVHFSPYGHTIASEFLLSKVNEQNLISCKNN